MAETVDCSIDGCSNNAAGGGICHKHGGKQIPKKCSVDGCSSNAKRLGYCMRHGNTVPSFHTKCKRRGCSTNARVGGFCIKHSPYIPPPRIPTSPSPPLDDAKDEGGDDSDTNDEVFFDGYDSDDEYLSDDEDDLSFGGKSDTNDDNISILYLMRIKFPSGFITKIRTFGDAGKNLARRLCATKVGQSRSERLFKKKMGRYGTYFPFGTLEYIAIKVDRTKNQIKVGERGELRGFTSKDAEAATHYLYTADLIAGEWYDLNDEKWVRIKNRMESLGCVVCNIVGTNFPKLCKNKTRGTPGFVYMATFDWSGEDLAIINQMGSNNSISNDFKRVCREMVSTKVGSTKYDLDSWYGRKGRYIWATSFLTNSKCINCVGMRCPKDCRKFEQEVHGELENVRTRAGEWFHLSKDLGKDAEYVLDFYRTKIDVNIEEHQWKRKVLSQSGVLGLLGWLEWKLVSEDEFVHHHDRSYDAM